MAYYLDTSAAAKLVISEPETPAMIAWANRHSGDIISSDLTRTELIRAVRRTHPDRIHQARAVLESIDLMALTTDIYERAATLDPAQLRSLDALHLAAAMELGAELDGLITYDERLATATQTHGIPTPTPQLN